MTTITTKLTGKEAVTFAQLRSSHQSPSMMITKMEISADEDFPNLPIFCQVAYGRVLRALSLSGAWKVVNMESDHTIKHFQCPFLTWPKNIKIQIEI